MRGWFRDDVEQNFTHLARASSDRVALLILYCIDLSVSVQWKNHWFSVHSKGLLAPGLYNKSALIIKTGTPRHEGAGVNYSFRDLNRFLTAPAIPSRPVPSRNMLVGSGTGLLVICPWTVVIPLFDAGGTRFSGLLVME